MDRKAKLILVVEDQPINRQIIKKILEPEYRVAEASNGKEGVQFLEKNPDTTAVLLDIVMPIMDGYSFLQAVQTVKDINLPIIVMTGEQDPDSEQRALDAGAWDFVTKPLRANILRSRLKNAIARSEVALYEQMQYISEYDELTGMYNRRKMFSQVQKMLKNNPQEKFVFLRMDIDHFKLFNSAFGDKQGDQLLVFMAQLIQKTESQFTHQICGKMDADIFCICESYDAQALEQQVMQIYQGLTQYKKDYLLEISCGAFLVESSEQPVESMYVCASLAAQKCKHQYLQPLAFYDAGEGKKSEQEIAITNEMQEALDQKQFVVYFQPKFQLSNDTAFGAEALVRWKHPVKGLIPPGVFIPVFEKNGFIAKLDYYVWDQVCAWLRHWLDAGYFPHPISVNISRVSLYNPHICQIFLDLIKKYDLSPTLLHLEITESAYMSNPELMQNTISSLHKSGFTIMMDDFGSGYSSLNTLKDIEVDVIKFDMKFLPTTNDVAKGEIILISTIRMVNWLGMSVVVEGVETEKQRDFLEGIGCDYVQGYYYARPMPAELYEREYILLQKTGHLKKSQFSHPEPVQRLERDAILIVDDDEINRSLLELYLEDQFVVYQCCSAEEAITFLQHNNTIRLILIDNYMDGMSGLDFLQYAKTNPVLSAIPKIMITAGEHIENQIKAFQFGAYDYITKPFMKEVVVARVEHALEIKQQLRTVESVGKEYKLLSEKDSMTGLYNKATSKKLCTHMLEGNPDTTKALLVLDIDDFKQINDTQGHLIGDKVIRCIADQLQHSFRKSDVVGRYGGDEFIVMMDDLPGEDAGLRKASEVIKDIHFACLEKLQLTVSVSIGLALVHEGDVFDSLFARADQALYTAKNGGKSKVCMYGECVPPIADDDKPIILICGEDPQLYPAIALAYGNSCAFAQITSFEDLRNIFAAYPQRIVAICMDVKKQTEEDADAFYACIIQNGGGSHIPILAVCQESNLEHLRRALKLNIFDIITLPPQTDTIRKRISRCLCETKHLNHV